VKVELRLYDQLGREVIREIISSEKSLSVATPGIYFYQLRIGEKSASGKLITE